MIAWLWARTVKSPNPAFADVDVPLASTFMLSTKKGKEAYVEPVIEGRGYRFTVKVGAPPDADAAKATARRAARRTSHTMRRLSAEPVAPRPAQTPELSFPVSTAVRRLFEAPRPRSWGCFDSAR